MRSLLALGLIFPILASAKDGSRKSEEMVELKKFAPRVVIELRYTTWHNLAKKALYPKNARAFLRRGVAEKIVRAQEWLDTKAPSGIRLKIWDAWRPAWAHKQLWDALPNREYLRDPREGGSLHTWGVCVDATLVDKDGNDLKMPTEFDAVGPESKTRYDGNDPKVKRNLYYLQSAMSVAGFFVVRDEWWHFCAKDWEEYAEIDLSITGDEVPK